MLLFEVDTEFLNADQHLNGISVPKEDRQFDYYSIFNSGYPVEEMDETDLKNTIG